MCIKTNLLHLPPKKFEFLAGLGMGMFPTLTPGATATNSSNFFDDLSSVVPVSSCFQLPYVALISRQLKTILVPFCFLI
jgi:hypothetical protein